MIEILLLVVLIVLVLVLIFKKNNSNSNTADVEKFSGIIEGQLKTQPDLVSSKIGEVLQTKFSEFKDNLNKSLGKNTEKLTLGLNTFKETFKKDLIVDFDKLNKTVENSYGYSYFHSNETLNKIYKQLKLEI